MIDRLEGHAAGARDGPLVDLLTQAGALLGELGPEFTSDLSRLDALRQRLREERCHLAVLGQFKRGKSTLINALLGEPVLPVAVVPVTSIPTFLHGSDQLAARIQFDDGKAEEHFQGTSAAALSEFLARFVTESGNPHNRLAVRLVEASYPASVLQQGLQLIDTPGIGSTYRHNTETTVNFLPQCDAAMFVVSADPPITEVEVEFLKAARIKLARIFFVLNKVDYLDVEERRSAVAFLQHVLGEQVGFDSPPPIFCVSARQGLAACKNHDAEAWQRSGMEDIERQIVDFLLTEKAEVLSLAMRQKIDWILADVQCRLQLTVRSLQMPLAELEQRIDQFELSLTEIDEQRIVAMEHLARDEKRLSDSVSMRAAQLLPTSLAHFRGLVQQCKDREGAQWSEESTSNAIAEAIPSYFEREFGLEFERCEQELRKALLPHRRRAEELIVLVQKSIERLFDAPFEPVQQEQTLARIEHPSWRTHKWTFKFTSIPETWVDRLFPRRLRHARIRRRLMEQVEYLVTRNVGFLRWSILENLQQSIQDFSRQWNDRAQKAIETTRQALDAARRQRAYGSTALTPKIARLESSIADLKALRKRYSPDADTAHSADPRKAMG